MFNMQCDREASCEEAPPRASRRAKNQETLAKCQQWLCDPNNKVMLTPAHQHLTQNCEG